jgi:uracil-DNA glycosylase family 4
LAFLKPRIVILLGRHALVSVAPQLKISSVHGKPFRKVSEDRWYCPAYHPAATLYSPTLKAAFEQDIQAARDRFDLLGAN